MTAALERGKSGKTFALWDIPVYCILTAMIVALFFFCLRGNGAAQGYRIVVGEETAVTYTFGAGAIVDEAWRERVEIEQSEDAALVTVKVGDGFNTVKIDLIKRTAVMWKSDCSRTKDCMLTGGIGDRGVIVCAPHRLKVVPIGDKEDFSHPAIG